MSENWTNPRGNAIFTRKWLPVGPPRALLIVVHGMAEHCSRYERFAQYFTKAGFAVHALDLQGHGQSGGARLWVESFEDYVQDVDTFIKKVVPQYPKIPHFLFGHSMGGAIALVTALRNPSQFSGYVFSAPAILKGDDVPDWIVSVGKVVEWIWPSMGLKKIPIVDLTSIEEEQKAVENDPLMFHGWVPARCGMACLHMMAWVQQNWHTANFPFLVVHGTDDKICTIRGSELLMQHAPSQDKQFIRYEGIRHEPHFDRVEVQERADILAWLNAHMRLRSSL